MTHSPAHRILVSAALAATLLVAGCGDTAGLIPESDAQSILTGLDRLEQQIDDGDCDNVPATVADLQEQVSELPRSVDARLRARIEEGLANLATLAPRDCLDQKLTTTTTTTTTTTATTTTTTTPTQTTPTQTQTPPQPVPTPTQTQTPTQPTPTPTTPTPPSGGGGTSPDPDTGGATPDTGGSSAP